MTVSSKACMMEAMWAENTDALWANTMGMMLGAIPQ